MNLSTFTKFTSVCLALALAAGLPIAATAAESILLKGGIVHTVTGKTLTPGDVLISDGKVVAVAQFVDSDSARTIYLEGKHVYPGLIALDSSQGMIEIESVRATLDTTEVGDYTPDVQAWVAVN